MDQYRSPFCEGQRELCRREFEAISHLEAGLTLTSFLSDEVVPFHIT